MKVIVIKRPDGGISIMPINPESKKPDETNEEWYARSAEGGMRGELAGLPWEVVDKSELPPSREERNAWEKEKDKPIKINKAKSDEIKIAKEMKKVTEDEKRQKAIDNLTARGEI